MGIIFAANCDYWCGGRSFILFMGCAGILSNTALSLDKGRLAIICLGMR